MKGISSPCAFLFRFIYICYNHHVFIHYTTCTRTVSKTLQNGIKQIVRLFLRSLLPQQRRAFCSHREIPPRRPQTSISVFPQELPPGTRGQSAASCQPRNVTSPQTHTYTHLLPYTKPHGCLPAPEHCNLLCISIGRQGGHTLKMNKREVCLHIAAQAHCGMGSLEACVTQLQGTERKVIIL